MRPISLLGLSTCLLLAPRASKVAHAQSQADDRVEFRLTEATASGAIRLLEAEYSVGGGIAHFALALEPLTSASRNVSFTKLALLSRPGSDSRVLLAALARIHSGSLSRKKSPRLSRLDITAAVLGQSLSHGPGKDVIAGEFSPTPAGDWLVLKLFLDTPDGATVANIGEPAEMFVALNPKAGRGWFLVKDPEYWPELNRVLAMVL